MLSDSERSLLLEELARRPRGLADSFTHEATLTTPACGDTVTVRLTLDPASSEMQEVSWDGHGCTVSMTATAALCVLPLTDTPSFRKLHAAYTDSVDGGAVLEDDLLADLEPFAGIGRFPLRAQCATLAWRTLASAIDVGAVPQV